MHRLDTLTHYSWHILSSNIISRFRCRLLPLVISTFLSFIFFLFFINIFLLFSSLSHSFLSDYYFHFFQFLFLMFRSLQITASYWLSLYFFLSLHSFPSLFCHLILFSFFSIFSFSIFLHISVTHSSSWCLLHSSSFIRYHIFDSRFFVRFEFSSSSRPELSPVSPQFSAFFFALRAMPLLRALRVFGYCVLRNFI